MNRKMNKKLIKDPDPELPDTGPDAVLLIMRRDYNSPMKTRLRFSDWNLPCVYCVQCQQPQPKQNKQLHQLTHFPPGKNFVLIIELTPGQETSPSEMWRKTVKHRKIRPRSSRSRNPMYDVSTSSSEETTTQAQASSAAGGDQRTCAHYSNSNDNKTGIQNPEGKYHKYYKYYKRCSKTKEGLQKLGTTNPASPNSEADPTSLAWYDRINLVNTFLESYASDRIFPRLDNGCYMPNQKITHSKTLVSLIVKRSPVKRTKMSS